MSNKKKTHVKAYLSITLTLLLTFSLLTGVFSPKTQIPEARAATALTNVSNTVTDTQASATTTHQINFTTYTSIPADGKIIITFPAGFNVTSTSFNSWSGLDGSQTISTSSQTITVTRNGAGTASAAGVKYIKLDNIVNNSSTSTSYSVIIETQDSTGTTLDGPTTSFRFSVCENACHTSTYQIPWDARVSTSTTHTTKFTTASTTPANGKIKLTFPAGFDVSSASTTELNGSDVNYLLTQSISGQTITITNASTSAITAGTLYVVMEGITNHSTAGTYYVTVETASNTDVNIEGPTSIRLSVNSTGLGLAGTAWPSTKGNNLSQSRGTVNTSDYYTMKWRNSELVAHRAETVVAPDGTLYTGNYLGSKLYAINPSDGSTIWTYTTGGAVGTPAVSAAGAIYAKSYAGYLYALDSSGSLLWKYYVGVGHYDWTGFAGPKIGNDGTIYIPGGSSFFALDPDGTLKWTYSSGISAYSTPAIASNGTIYQVGGAGVLAFNPDGTTKWNSASGQWRGPVVIDDDGTVYTKHLVSINPSDGGINWTYPEGGSGHDAGGMAVSADGGVYFGERGYNPNLFHSISGNGGENWNYDIGQINYGSATVDLNGTHVYIHSSSGASTPRRLYAFDNNGNLKWKRLQDVDGDQYGGGITIDSDGSLYVTSHEGGLSALQPWTLTASVNPSGVYNTGDTATFTAITSMLQTDPVTSEGNQAQVYLDNGTIIPLTYSSTNSDGNTVWTGTWTVLERGSSAASIGTHTATIQAAAVNVETDTTTNFSSAPTNSNNTGITATVTYRIVPRAVVMIYQGGGSSPAPEPESELELEAATTDLTTPTGAAVSTTADNQTLIQELKAQIAEIQQKIIELLTHLIQLIQQQIAELQSQLHQE